MLSKFVGEDSFLKGVTIYLKKHLYANSVTQDLWQGIQEATGLNIPKLMDNWIKKVGYPVITVTETKDGIHLRQDRFLETGPASPDENETIWTVPLSLLSVSDNGDILLDTQAVLDSREKTISLDISKPFKLNAGTISFCRVLYTPERLVAIGKEAAKNPSLFSIVDRLGLVYDALELARAGLATVSSALSLIDVLRDETEVVVLKSIAGNLSILSSVWWEYPNMVESLQAFERGIFVPIVKRLGYEFSEGEDVDSRALRELSITRAALSGDLSVIQELTSRFAHYIRTGDDSTIPADLEGIIYTIAVRYGGRDEWNAVKRIGSRPKNPASGIAAMTAMGHTSDLELAKETFQYILSECRDQDLDYQETAEFFKDKDTARYRLALQSTLSNIASRAAWVKRSTDDIEGWLEASMKKDIR
ncbi:uncharacterized protein FIBRA_06527 [Fibroporia radiculosa]|uniref:Peptidase M1 membrane alanine aminopeptidase domain-containing protein n=1 Tax=Fibroporia radiculosa TaxID=599839 RepID=J4GSW9_9APHY|nr:uncharacterized protein FIBRA_06527 [Fibroporia radiculosa]CCM04355.1 predicted protein [Fibroporia radiculosa]